MVNEIEEFISNIPSNGKLMLSCPKEDNEAKVDIITYCPKCPYFGGYGKVEGMDEKSINRQIFIKCNFHRLITPSLYYMKEEKNGST